MGIEMKKGSIGLHGIWDDITGSFSAAESNIENVVLPYWSSKIQSVAGSAGKTLGDLLGWLQDIDASIASGNTYYEQLVAAGKNTSQDDAMSENIATSQTDLNNQLQGVATSIQSGATSGNGWQTVTISSNPADTSSPNTFNVTTDLLPSGTSGLGLVPAIAVAVVGVAITGAIVYKIYELKTNSEQYSQYMQARAEAIKNGTPLPPLPPALAQYTASSGLAWLLGGIVVAAIGGTIIYAKYFRKHERHTVYQNPTSAKRHQFRLLVGEKGNEMGHFVSTNASSIKGAKIALGKALEPYKGDGWGKILIKRENGEYDELPNQNPYSTEHYKHIDIEPSSHFRPDTIRTVKRGSYRFIVGKPKSRYMGHTGYHGGATRAIAELKPR